MWRMYAFVILSGFIRPPSVSVTSGKSFERLIWSRRDMANPGTATSLREVSDFGKSLCGFPLTVVIASSTTTWPPFRSPQSRAAISDRLSPQPTATRTAGSIGWPWKCSSSKMT